MAILFRSRAELESSKPDKLSLDISLLIRPLGVETKNSRRNGPLSSHNEISAW